MTIKKNQEFTIKYILPAVALILTIITIGQLYTTSITENDLKETSGTVSRIMQDKYKHYKYTDDRIRIWSDNGDIFYFFDNRDDFFKKLRDSISIGDYLTISHRTYLQSWIGTGDEHKIMKIKKGNTTLYSFDQAKETFRNTGSFGSYVTIVMWIAYVFLIRKLK